MLLHFGLSPSVCFHFDLLVWLSIEFVLQRLLGRFLASLECFGTHRPFVVSTAEAIEIISVVSEIGGGSSEVAVAFNPRQPRLRHLVFTGQMFEEAGDNLLWNRLIAFRWIFSFNVVSTRIQNLKKVADLPSIVEIAVTLKTQLEAIEETDDEKLTEPLNDAIQLAVAVALLLSRSPETLIPMTKLVKSLVAFINNKRDRDQPTTRLFDALADNPITAAILDEFPTRIFNSIQQ